MEPTRNDAQQVVNSNAGTSPDSSPSGGLTAKARRILARQYEFAVGEELQGLLFQGETGLGKTSTALRTLGAAGDDVTGGEEVIIALPTRDARNEKYQEAIEEGIKSFKYEGRFDLCGTAKGEYNEELGSVDGEDASDWLNHQANKGLPPRMVHRELEERVGDLPCREDGGCDWVKQSKEYDESDHRLAFVTHEMLRSPKFREGTNVIVDEMPQYQMGLDDPDGVSRKHLRKAIELRLEYADAYIHSWPRLVKELKSDPMGRAVEETRDAVMSSGRPPSEWYIRHYWAHTMAEPVLRALLDGETVSRDWRFKGEITWPGETTPAPAVSQEHITVLLDHEWELQRIWVTPNFECCRSLICLDAHPYELRWETNIGMDVHTIRTLEENEAKRWRQGERGLHVIQVGENRNPVTTGKTWSPAKARAIIAEAMKETGGRLRSAITSMAVEEQVAEMLAELGQRDPVTLHYGEQMGVDTLGDDDYGLVLGHIDPSDDDVMDYVAYHGLDAEPAVEKCPVCTDSSSDECGQCGGLGWVRARGRKFDGGDAEEATEILNGVVQRQVAQAVGRYGRNASDPDDEAIVWVWTSVVPDYLVDVVSEGVVNAASGEKLKIIERLARDYTTVPEIVEMEGVKKRWAYEVVRQLRNRGVVEVSEGTGKWNADEYRLADDGNPYGTVSLGIDRLEVLRNQGVHSTVLSKQHRRPTTHPGSLTGSPKPSDGEVEAAREQARQEAAAQSLQEKRQKAREQMRRANQ